MHQEIVQKYDAAILQNGTVIVFKLEKEKL